MAKLTWASLAASSCKILSIPSRQPPSTQHGKLKLKQYGAPLRPPLPPLLSCPHASVHHRAPLQRQLPRPLCQPSPAPAIQVIVHWLQPSPQQDPCAPAIQAKAHWSPQSNPSPAIQATGQCRPQSNPVPHTPVSPHHPSFWCPTPAQPFPLTVPPFSQAQLAPPHPWHPAPRACTALLTPTQHDPA